MRHMSIVMYFLLFFLMSTHAGAAEGVVIEPDVPTETKEMIEIIIDLKEDPLSIKEKNAEEQNETFDAATAEKERQDTAELFIEFLESENIVYTQLNEFEEVFNGFSLFIQADQIEMLTSLDFINIIQRSHVYEAVDNKDADPEEQFKAVHNEISALSTLGLTGKGVKIGVIDTGIDFHHPDLKHAYKGGANFVEDGRTSPLEGRNGVTSTHGTNVSGVIAGKGRVNGIAPNAAIYSYRALDNTNKGTTTSILNSLEQAAKDNVDIVNMSIGNKNNNPDTSLTKAINNTVLNGIVVVAASGNNGSSKETVGEPGTAALAITVGASHLINGKEYTAPFSSRGPVKTSLDIKPDVLAPGVSIFSTASRSTTGTTSYTNAYGTYDGTSLAAPYVAGVAALMLEQNASYTPEEVKARIMNTASAVTNAGVNDAGAGRVNPQAALNTTASALIKDSHQYEEEGKQKKHDYWNGSLNINRLKVGGEFKEDRTIQLRNYSAEPVTYSIKSEPIGSSALKLQTPSSVTLKGKETKEIPISFLSSFMDKGGYYQGYIHFQSSGKPAIRIPYGGVIEIGEDPINSFSAGAAVINGTKNLPLNWSLRSGYNPSLALLEKDTKKVLGQIPLRQGATSLSWDMIYNTPGGNKKISDGDYLLRLTGSAGSSSAIKDIPLKIYSVKPQVKIDKQTVQRNQISGQIISYFSQQKEADTSLTGSFELKQDGNRYESGNLAINKEGKFTINNKLRDGASELIIKVEDRAGNTVSYTAGILKEVEAYSLGDNGAGVGDLQAMLKKLGFDPNKDEKLIFGAHTENQIIELQKYYGLEVSGKADESVLKFMTNIVNGDFSSPSSTPEVIGFKQKLSHLGFGTFPDNPSQVYGSVTAGVVKDYQRFYNLKDNGIGDPVTLEHMERQWTLSLKIGDNSEEVRELKQNLTRLGHGSFPDRPSSAYGSVTSSVVKEFQERAGLRVSGTANSITLKEIDHLLSQAWKSGDSDPEITRLKIELTRLGYGNFPTKPSGVYGSVTTAVVKDFQRDQQLMVTGNIDRTTEKKMSELSEILFSIGASGSQEIVKIKQQLTQLGFGSFPANPSTVYGSVTASVVKEFQEYHRLEKSGEVTNRVIQLLDRDTNTFYQAGSASVEIRDIKIQLTKLGYGNFPSSPSQVYGRVTAGVVAEFQASKGLTVNGIVDSITYEALFG
ncbi:peptidoglycan-binding protein [Alkalicoccus daliensis]|uniref:Putative peptidoglycan binding domain-containing protein n=1 Tax=Alkalicoccus daliensis TaxID=745820 RepID=A0A1H0GI13_9BACI|nr:peptidoglycan-binding protein [Alkalicoccus daliensis]SDO06452.1 Putative peptidoglycan binding domain-containing protein [Alkalicoccus daliensis]